MAHCGGAVCQPREEWGPCACRCQACFRVINIHRRAGISGCTLDDWLPNRGPQTIFLQSTAYEALTGGAMGGSKTESGIVGALRLVGNRRYRGLLLRRQYTQLVDTILPRCRELYERSDVGARWMAGTRYFVFPSGARIKLGASDNEKDIEKFQGTEWQYIYFDELQHFTLKMYLFMMGRLRSSHGVPLRIRAGANPGGVGHEWILGRFAPWLYPAHSDQYAGQRAEAGEVLYFRRAGEGDEEVICRKNDPDARARVFFPSRVTDTPQLGAEYRSNLAAMSRIERARYRDGDWLVKDAAGEFFQRGWFIGPEGKVYDAAPAQVLDRLRYWDLASTPANKTTPSSAWTAGVRISVTADGLFWIEDIVRGQWSPGDVRRTILATAITDPPGTRVIIERDPGQAGADQASEYARILAQYAVQAIPPQGDKLARARPPSAQAEAGNIRICKLPGSRWQEPFFNEADQFPEGTKDQIDGLSGAYRILARVLAQHDAARAPTNTTPRRDPLPAQTRRGGFA